MTRQASSVEMARVCFSRLLTVRELADLLQVPRKTIYTEGPGDQRHHITA
jgi:hypothetical protein